MAGHETGRQSAERTLHGRHDRAFGAAHIGENGVGRERRCEPAHDGFGAAHRHGQHHYVGAAGRLGGIERIRVDDTQLFGFAELGFVAPGARDFAAGIGRLQGAGERTADEADADNADTAQHGITGRGRSPVQRPAANP